MLVDMDYQEKLEIIPALGMNQPVTASQPSQAVAGNQGLQMLLAEQSFPGRLCCLGRR